MPFQLLRRLLAENRADLVARKLAPLVSVRDGRRASVGVGVGGDDEVRPDPASRCDREVERARLLGIRKGDGGEVGIRLALFGHLDDVAKARGREDAAHDLRADAVHRRVDDSQVARPGGDERGAFGHVGIDELLADSRIVGCQGDVGGGPRRLNLSRDLRVGRGNQLDAPSVLVGVRAAEVHLVAVVASRVVRRRDHHPGVGAECAHRVGEDRRRQRPGKNRRAQAGRRCDCGGVLGELPRVAARVVADDEEGVSAGLLAKIG